jgi:hypothetical protein
MTIRIAALALMIFTVSAVRAQHFEGKIVYRNSFKSKIPGLTDAQFTEMIGTTQDYFIKGGDYRSTTNGTFFQWQVYLNKDNKLYSKVTNSPVVLWNDCAENPDAMVKAELNRKVATILGYECDELVLTTKNGVQKFYFSSKVSVDGKLFENHKYQNWNEVLARANAMPLKMILDNAQFSKGIATEVVPMKLEDKLFELPADAQLQKSPY